jgi:hemoglobin
MIAGMKKDIQSFEDIQLMVNEFYARIREDEMLAPVFRSRIPDDSWAPHLAKMYTFWQTILLPGEQTYRGTPFAHHVRLPIEGPHFERWLKLFTETVDTLFSGAVAEEAKFRARSIAGIFEHKLSQINAASRGKNQGH